MRRQFQDSVWPVGATCQHREMRSCCKPACGHIYCPRCGLTWDEAAEGDPRYVPRLASEMDR